MTAMKDSRTLKGASGFATGQFPVQSEAGYDSCAHKRQSTPNNLRGSVILKFARQAVADV
jgi:hypothetical protein